MRPALRTRPLPRGNPAASAAPASSFGSGATRARRTLPRAGRRWRPRGQVFLRPERWPVAPRGAGSRRPVIGRGRGECRTLSGRGRPYPARRPSTDQNGCGARARAPGAQPGIPTGGNTLAGKHNFYEIMDSKNDIKVLFQNSKPFSTRK